MIKAPDASRFCSILTSASHYKLPGSWIGSAYRYHPRGVIRRGIIFTNDWSSYNYCSARVILDPTSKITNPINMPEAHHNRATPEPETGGTLRVYWTGEWREDDGPWRQIILDVLAGLETEIASAKAVEADEMAEKIRQSAAARQNALEQARAALASA